MTTPFKYFLPALLWALIIMVLSTFGNVRAPNLLPYLLSPDKLGHAAAYFVQAALLSWGFYKTGNTRGRAWLLSILISGVMGVSLEFVQYLFFPRRFFETLDMLANLSGAALSSFLTLFFYRNKT